METGHDLHHLTNFAFDLPYNNPRKHEGGVKMYYQLYLDVLFLVNFLMDFYMIFFVKRVMKISYTWKKTFLGAIVGAIAGCFTPFAYGIPIFIKIIYSYLGIGLIMVWAGFPKVNRRGKIKRYMVLLGCSFFLGGINFFLQYKWSMSYIKSMGFTVVISFIILEILQKIKQYRSNIFEVKLLVAGETIRLKGLYDTGNSLVCPWNGKEVHVADETIFEGVLSSEDGREKLPEYQIPFSSVGKSKGLLRTVQISAMTIEGDDGVEVVKSAPLIGLGSKELFDKKPYQVILHSRSF